MEKVKFHKVVCPNCGAPIKLDNENQGRCEYCGTSYHVEDDPSVEKITEEGFKEPTGEEVVSDILDFVGDAIADSIEDNASFDVKIDESMKKTKSIGKKLLYLLGLVLLFIFMELFSN